MPPDPLARVQGPTHNVLRLALRPLLGGSSTGIDAQKAPEGIIGSAAAGSAFEMGGAVRVLTAAHLTDALPTEVRERLASAEGLRLCCIALQQLPAPGGVPPVRRGAGFRAGAPESAVKDLDGRQSADSAPLQPQDYLHAMLNLAALALCSGADAGVGLHLSFIS